ncbi:MAG: DUF11 domain-containing protein [Pseudomonadota bacterium]
MAPAAYAQVTSETLVNNHGTLSTFSLPYTPATGENRAVLVIVFSEYSNGEQSNITSATLGGVPLVSLGTQENRDPSTKNNRMTAFYLPETSIPPGTSTFSVSYGPDPSSSLIYLATAIGVRQSTLATTPVSFNINCIGGSAPTNGTINFAPLSVLANDLVFSFAGTGNDDAFTTFNNGASEFLDERVSSPGFSLAGGLQAPQSDTTISGTASFTDGCHRRPITMQFAIRPLGEDGTLDGPGGHIVGETITYEVTDADLNLRTAVVDDVTIEVVNQTTGETETVTLTETGPDTGIFRGTLATSTTPGPGTDNTGTMAVQSGETLSATYTDALDANGGMSIRTVLTNLVPNGSEADLALSITGPAATPTRGFSDPYTVTLVNQGLTDGTGVTVDLPLPSGYQLVSDDSAGAFDPDTDTWTVGRVSAGASRTLTLQLAHLASGSSLITAEVASMVEVDADSTPGNGAPSEDDQDSLDPFPARGIGGPVPSRSCPGPFDTLDWDTLTSVWVDGSLDQTVTSADGGDIRVQFSGDIADMDSFNHGLNSGFTGGLSPAEQSLRYFVNAADRAQTVTATFTLGSPGTGVDDLAFQMFDVDSRSNRSYSDGIRVIGSLGGASVLPVLTSGGTANSVLDNEVVGLIGNSSSNPNGNVSVNFDRPVDTLTITLFSGDIARREDPTSQGFSIHDLSFCTLSGELSASKSMSMAGGTANTFAIPGNDVIYTISIESTGTAPIDAGSILLVDKLPSSVMFFNGDVEAGDGDTDPVRFVQSGAGLSYDFSRDVAFSNTNTPPTTFSDCTYAPSAGYDPAVTFICIAPDGIMAAGDPNPTAEFAFRTRIR